MGFATHLGPWLLGTTKNTTGSTAALTRNTGCTVVSQSANVVYGTLTGNAISIPAGAQIVDVTKQEVHADINRVLDRLDRLDEKLDRLMESKHASNK